MKNLSTLTSEELRNLRNEIDTLLVSRLEVGLPVTVDDNKVKGWVGTIVKINRTKCRINFGSKGMWNVPKKMINLV